MRRLRHKTMNVCQNCRHSNNKKGMWRRTWKRKDIHKYIHKINPNIKRVYYKLGYWHIYCEKKEKYYPWDYKKRCIERGIVR